MVPVRCRSRCFWYARLQLGRRASRALPALDADQVVQRLMEKNKERAEGLQHYSGKRSYRLEYRGFPTSAEATMEVEVNFDAPASKRFTIVSATGSKLIQNRVFHRLLESEEQAGDSSNRKHTELGPDNYTFSLAGTEGTNYVLNVEPKVDEPVPVSRQDLGRRTRLRRHAHRGPAGPESIVLDHEVGDPSHLSEGGQWILSAEGEQDSDQRPAGRGGDSDHRIPVLPSDGASKTVVSTRREIPSGEGTAWADGGGNDEGASFLLRKR